MSRFKVFIRPAGDKVELDRIAYDTLGRDVLEYHITRHKFRYFQLIFITYKRRSQL